MPHTTDPLVRSYKPETVEQVLRFVPRRGIPEVGTPVVEDNAQSPAGPVREIGGRKDGPDPTRYGDWEKNGRCIDF